MYEQNDEERRRERERKKGIEQNDAFWVFVIRFRRNMVKYQRE